MASKRQRIPKLSHSSKRGYHVSYRDPITGKARRHTFGQVSEKEALAQSHRWVADRLNGEPTNGASPAPNEPEQPPRKTSTSQVIDGCIAIIASSLLRQEESRVWDGTGTKARGMISAGVHNDRKGHLSEFLAFLNEQHGRGAVGRMRLEDLALLDVEKYNRKLAQAGLSASSVNKRMQVVKRIIDHAGRPEGDLLFVTSTGLPIVRDRTDTVVPWWMKLRKSLGYKDSLSGFYTLRHLGATEFGSRPGASLNEVRGWLGHAAGSEMADVYMKPVSPEYREVVEWVRKALQSGEVDLKGTS